MRKKIEKILKSIRLRLRSDGGDIELIDVDECSGVIKVKLVGACRSCSMSSATMKYYIEDEIKKNIPEIKKIESI
jgi:Fe-S cluster biogenesis protein NfuA